MMAKYGANLFMLNLSPGGTGFAVPRSQYPSVADVLDGLVVPINGTIYVIQIGHPSKQVETQAALLEPLGNVQRVRVELTEGCSMVSMIGHEYMQQAGLFRKVLELEPDAYTKSWSLLYLGRLADSQQRHDEAVEHYKAALAVAGVPDSVRKAAEQGINEAFIKK